MKEQRVYLRADENGAGVTVEDAALGDVRLSQELFFNRQEIVLRLNGAVASLDGLLRWMLETYGFDAANDTLVKAVRKWQEDGRPNRQKDGE